MRAVLLYWNDTGHVLGGYTDRTSSSDDPPTVASMLGEGVSLEVAIVSNAAPPAELVSVPFGPEKLSVAVTTDPALLEKSFGQLGVIGKDDSQVVELLPSTGVQLDLANRKLELPSAPPRDTRAELHGATTMAGPIFIGAGTKENTFPVPLPTGAKLLLVAGYAPKWIT
jgi:hypothetical protein